MVQPDMPNPDIKKTRKWLILIVVLAICLLGAVSVLIYQNKKMAPEVVKSPPTSSQIKLTPQPLDFSSGTVVSITENQLTIKSGDQEKTFTLPSKVIVQKTSLASSSAIATNGQNIATISGSNTNLTTVQLSDIKIGQRVYLLMDKGKTEVKSILILQK